MENKKLSEIRELVSSLDRLQERLGRLSQELREAKEEEHAFLHKLEKETEDVKSLQKESFSTLLFKFINKYEDKLEKEQQEMLEAKWEYDKRVQRVQELKKDKIKLQERIALLKTYEKEYQEELKKRETKLLLNKNSEAYLIYKNFELKEEELRSQLFEINEAISAGYRAQHTGETAEGLLGSARNWATYDAFTNGGLLSHMVKYDKIDSAQIEINRLQVQLQSFIRELEDVKDINLQGEFGIDNSTRTIDFWFDNIFTDLRVRNKIDSDSKKVLESIHHIKRIIDKLCQKRNTIEWNIAQLQEERQMFLAEYTGA
ncbi:hypothetical protein CS063_08010 [Sporanaerobium hydrogeniformans]|uniref:Uncharacterized protein n=1 Tax=Sporanaerobium hydrogeniformans TaxID=3072179 RepID=A0AC61DCX5_9FIRM|nr:hypothetical protein [Sporanaerobium hydrogeniformans]PHV70953.1 hypothetical protein CS063_08010 [Sporanaerobium hydrogeniformans]